ncbi:MAG: thiamine biosynthesis protein ThiF [Sulfurimonas sp.]|nr:thiamine biosynthesis protein ThiF [Sulfurimonas sp.]
MSDYKISCTGIVGDGCGGGREFIIENEILFAHDPQSGKNITLLEHIKGAKTISKKACILYVECEKERFEFDLSLMKRIS